MTSPDRRCGSAPIQGELWGARARDWAEVQERRHRPLFEDAIRRMDIRPGTALLDVGCGAGGLCRLAADAGAEVTGIDAAHSLVEIARDRVPEGDISVGDLEFLPFRDDRFDVLTGLNSFQYAADPVAALVEAKRVTKPGSPILVVVWGRQSRTDLASIVGALKPLLPPPPANALGPFALSEDGALEALVRQAGMVAVDGGYIEARFTYPDEEALLRGMLAAGPAALAISTSGLLAVEQATLAASAPFRTARGAYRIETEWRYVTVRA